MDVLLSIKPEFAEGILSGRKQYEFRKSSFQNEDAIDLIFIYSSSPVQKIVGAFTIDNVIEDSPEHLWTKYGSQFGDIDQSRFFDYYEDSQTGFAIKIERFIEFDSPIDPREEIPDFRPPVSFQYINGDFDCIFQQEDLACQIDLNQTKKLPQFSD